VKVIFLVVMFAKDSKLTFASEVGLMMSLRQARGEFGILLIAEKSHGCRHAGGRDNESSIEPGRYEREENSLTCSASMPVSVLLI
jgi:hypothetical protein